MTTIQSFFRPSAFAFVLRGRTVILGEVDDLRDGDLKVCGHRKHGYLQVAELNQGRQRMLGGLHKGQRHALSAEVAERVLDTMRTLRADDYFVVLAAMLCQPGSRRARPTAAERVTQAVQAAFVGKARRHGAAKPQRQPAAAAVAFAAGAAAC